MSDYKKSELYIKIRNKNSARFDTCTKNRIHHLITFTKIDYLSLNQSRYFRGYLYL